MSRDGTAAPTGNDERDGAVPTPPPNADQGRLGPSDTGGSRPPGLWERLRGRNGQEESSPADPWRVEGMPEDSRTPDQRPRGRFLWLLLVALLINWP